MKWWSSPSLLPLPGVGAFSACPLDDEDSNYNLPSEVDSSDSCEDDELLMANSDIEDDASSGAIIGVGGLSNPIACQPSGKVM
ncbi:hypothetical protein RJT34_03617 [Clitoria ternatea]|uniref:Uncharacterized protein n=1 Tax=Clitoria ternatea TaxID=43366 RepID=A0AAN9KNB4_CLITE